MWAGPRIIIRFVRLAVHHLLWWITVTKNVWIENTRFFCCMLWNLLCFWLCISVEWAEAFPSVLPQPRIQTLRSLRERKLWSDEFHGPSHMNFCVALWVLSEKRNIENCRTCWIPGLFCLFVLFLPFCTVNFYTICKMLHGAVNWGKYTRHFLKK